MIVCGKNVLLETPVKNINKVYLKENFQDKEVIEYLKKNKLKYETVPIFRLNKLTNLKHQGIVIDIHDYEYHKLEEAYNANFIVALDHLEDPHNLGAIIRTCECAGIKYIIIPKERCVHVNETVMKVSSGAISNVNIIMVNNLVDALKKLQKELFFIYTADMDGTSYKDLEYDNKCVLVIGSEGSGVSKLVKNISDFIIKIPMEGKINSLNASVSAGILIYGMRRK